MFKVAPSKRAKDSLATHRQVAAIPVRVRNGRVEVCLVTTRETKRWTVPKGWPMKAVKDREAAAIEARQEAGLIGKTDRQPLGTYLYWKRLDQHFALVEVTAYRLHVEKQLEGWDEAGQRSVIWVSAGDAALAVNETGLGTLLRDLERTAIN